VAKKDAEKAWEKLGPDEKMLKEILTGITKASLTPDWQKDGGRFIPHPATWLNGRRWEDEVETNGGSLHDFPRER
jgi:hypothetical protein